MNKELCGCKKGRKCFEDTPFFFFLIPPLCCSVFDEWVCVCVRVCLFVFLLSTATKSTRRSCISKAMVVVARSKSLLARVGLTCPARSENDGRFKVSLSGQEAKFPGKKR